ncbi:hypothetical protein M427DRAFT_273877 [Gonapodya prolifera JEL478]|uniref:Uncharacterized protein n=1 Tax=Gonapodya prolifera (strain JEL478) TaxID=1344416 RepID=A0A139AXZ3_GONPJ|nr:hypothetical protein M427DRAFT_273877 [Gonapodya prolifera JEL478]|eukprot:KXS21574.1 hypothetical protein M427DRAFT_273877 [Gonapodya prolifera JEL478]
MSNGLCTFSLNPPSWDEIVKIVPSGRPKLVPPELPFPPKTLGHRHGGHVRKLAGWRIGMSTIVLGGVSIPVPSAALVLTLTRLYYVVATTVALLGSYSGLFRSTVALYGKLLSNPSGTSSPMRHKKRSPSTAKSSIRLSQAFTTGTMPGYESSGASGRESSRSRSNSRSFSTRPTSAALGIDKPFLSLVALSEEPGKLEHAAHLLPENISREIQKGVDTIAELRVPKRWFTHFYAVGTLWFTWTLLELFVLLVWRKAFGPLMSIVMSTADSTGTCLPPNDTVSKLSGYFCGKIPALPLTESPLEATICTTLMLAQMLRRLAEELFLLNPSKGAQMHVGHYLLGLSFYGVTGVACWIEAAPALKKSFHLPSTIYHVNSNLYFHDWPFRLRFGGAESLSCLSRLPAPKCRTSLTSTSPHQRQ